MKKIKFRKSDDTLIRIYLRTLVKPKLHKRSKDYLVKNYLTVNSLYEICKKEIEEGRGDIYVTVDNRKNILPNMNSYFNSLNFLSFSNSYFKDDE